MFKFRHSVESHEWVAGVRNLGEQISWFQAGRPSEDDGVAQWLPSGIYRASIHVGLHMDAPVIE